MTAGLTFTKALDAVEKAAGRDDLFGGLAEADAQRRYIQYAKVLHPDKLDAGRRARGEAAFARLAALYQGDAAGPPPRMVIETKRRSYVLRTPHLWRGDVADLFSAMYAADEDGSLTQREALVKFPRSPRSTDLMEAEARSLRRLGKSTAPEWFPELLDTFRHDDRASRARRRVNVFARDDDGWVTVAAILRDFPDGIDPRDAAWIWRRVLTALNVAHDEGLVHGAVVPEHVLVHPTEHGVILLDWCYSVERGAKLRALPSPYRDWYPPEVPGKVTGATDIYLAHRLMDRLIDPMRRPRGLRAFLAGCTSSAPAARPSASEARAALDDLLERLYGPRRYRPFQMRSALTAEKEK